jgi:hypothetical protein
MGRTQEILEGLLEFLFDADDGGIDAAIERRASFRHGFRSFGGFRRLGRRGRSRGATTAATGAATAVAAATTVVAIKAGTEPIEQARTAWIAAVVVVVAGMAAATAAAGDYPRAAASVASIVATRVAAIVLATEVELGQLEAGTARIAAVIARRLARRGAMVAMVFHFATAGVATGVATAIAAVIATEPGPHAIQQARSATIVAAGRRTSAATTRPGGDHRSGCGWRGLSGRRIGTGHPSRSQQQVRYVHE